MIQQTSLEAFHAMQDSGELDGDELLIMKESDILGIITTDASKAKAA